MALLKSIYPKGEFIKGLKRAVFLRATSEVKLNKI